MNILHLLAVHQANGIGGPYSSVPQLAGAQNHLDGVRASLVMTHNNAASVAAACPVFNRRELFRGDGRVALRTPFDRPDLVVFHSTYIPHHALLAGRFLRLGIPYIICPRGGMTHSAQGSRWLKKRLGNFLFFNKFVARAAAVHYLTEGEAAASSCWNRPGFVAGNGVFMPCEKDLARPGRSVRRQLVFLGRLAVDHKGLDLLMDACALIAGELRALGARILLHGPDWRASRRWLARRIASLGLESHVLLPGPVTGQAKTEALRTADAMVLTSRWEGHPIAVLEALSHGVPCLLTPGTNLADQVAAAGAGWRVDFSTSSIAAGLQDVLHLDAVSLARAGAGARQLALSEFAWERIAARTVEAYRKFAA